MAIGCKKDDSENRSCLLTNLVDSLNNTYDYFYNDQGKVVRLDYNQRDPQIPGSSFTFEYDNTGKMIAQRFLSNTTKFIYDDKNLLVKTDFYKDTLNTLKLVGFHRMEYNAENKLVRRNRFSSAGTAYSVYDVYSYAGGNNEIVIQRTLDASTFPPLQWHKTEQHFDNMKKSVDMPGILTNDFISVSDHNVIFISDSTADGRISTINYSYTYNKEGYPQTRTSTSNQPDNNIVETTFMYNCK